MGPNKGFLLYYEYELHYCAKRYGKGFDFDKDASGAYVASSALMHPFPPVIEIYDIARSFFACALATFHVHSPVLIPFLKHGRLRLTERSLALEFLQ